jgi:hypothetical protein
MLGNVDWSDAQTGVGQFDREASMSSVSPPVLKRRGFLRLGAGGAALVVAGGAFRWFASGYASQLGPGETPIALTVKELAIVKAAVRALLPAEDGFPSGESLRIHLRVDEEVWSTSVGTRTDLKNGLQLLEHATIAYGYRGRFTALSEANRLAYLDRLMSGGNDSLRQIAVGLKEVIHIYYYAQPPIWRVIGYPGPLVTQAVPPESHLAYVELRKARGIL